MNNFLLLILNILGSVLYLIVLLLLLRFIIQAFKVDFFNPITQVIIRVTDPVLSPLRKILLLPGRRTFDYASLLLAFAVTSFQLSLPSIIQFGTTESLSILLLKGSLGLLQYLLDFYFFVLIFLIVVSWLAPHNAHPIIRLMKDISNPILAPFRRLIPPVGGLDLSILAVFIVLAALRSHLVPGLGELFFTQ